jgi:hypothetical protein
MTSGAALEAVVTERGLVVSPEELNKIGAHPGDRVVVSTRPLTRPRRMMGVGASKSGAAFTNKDLRQLRRDMGEGLGGDLVG